jgi:prepilin signal peptidase PulO-like enzyme (type II secretory pathway)
MWFAMLLGSATGLALNVACDRFCERTRNPCIRQHWQLQWGIVTLTTTILCVNLQGVYGWSLSFAKLLVCCSLLLLIATIDLRTRLVPNVLTAFGAALALAFGILLPSPGLWAVLEGTALGGVIFLLLAVLRRNAMGFGDVKLAVLIGMMTGFPWVLQALVLGIVLGGLAAAVLLLTRLRKPKQYIPYAPYLAAGAMLTLLYGARIAAWYASLKGGQG